MHLAVVPTAPGGPFLRSAKNPLKGYSGTVCFSKLKVAFYALIDVAGGILNA